MRHDRLRPLFSYLCDLQTRMDERGFSQADRLYQAVQGARVTMQLLVDHVHRLRCGNAYGGGGGADSGVALADEDEQCRQQYEAYQ